MDIIESGLKSLNVNDDYSLKKTESSEESTEKLAEIVVQVSGVRHCAFCLNAVDLKEIMKCGKCHKRAYCSKECQVKDWSLKYGGQGHKNWCGLECGEEDVDWEVAPVPGKGLGLIAKRTLPELYRILVDGLRRMDHPKIMELMPSNGSLAEKYDFNLFKCGPIHKGLCLRLGRANHDCNANADHLYDETFKVKILFAEREIAPGEEICFSYTGFKDIANTVTPEAWRFQLKNIFGITCPADCFCRDKEIHQLLGKGQFLHAKLFNLDGSLKSYKDDGLETVMQLLDSENSRLPCGFRNQVKILIAGYQIATANINAKVVGSPSFPKDLLEEISVRAKGLRQQLIKEYVKHAYDIESSITSPYSTDALKYLSYCQQHGVEVDNTNLH